jgi:seryl-tRNA synthetase
MSSVFFEFPQQPPIPKFLIKDVLAKLAYVDERVRAAKISSSGELITLELSSEASSDSREELSRRVASLVEAMSDNAFEPELKIIEQHSFSGSNQTDPMGELASRREVVEEGPGYFVLGPLLTAVVAHIEERILEVAREMQATQYRFPSLISPAYMERVEYFRNFPHSLSFATHLRENLPDIQRFSCEAVTVDGVISADSAVYAPVSAMLAPTVCHHLYLTMSDCRIEGDGITATATGNCFRFESRNMRSLERVWNFTMREIIFVGTDSYVRACIEEVRNRIRPLLHELELTYSVMTANDPFFIGTFRDQAAYQAAFELKHEIRTPLPFKGETIAVGSYNRHGDFFGRSLNITLADGSSANTGCVGIGFERIAYAFVCQHGIDPAKWPSALRQAVADSPTSPRFAPNPRQEVQK